VAPDDKATRVTYGLLNLCHRDSHKTPAPLEPRQRYRIRLELNDVAQVFPAGHRLRLSISTSYWPLAWPPPEPVRLTLYDRPSRLILPVRARRAEDEQLQAFGEAEGTAPIPCVMLEPAHHNWYVHRDLAEDVSTLEVINDDGVVRLEDLALDVRVKAVERYSSRDDDFGSIRGETHWERGLRRRDWSVRTVTYTLLTSTANAFRLHAYLDAFEGERRVYSRSWNYTIPRDLV
jgi:hypothetical protein